jgi:hypothetical protein
MISERLNVRRHTNLKYHSVLYFVLPFSVLHICIISSELQIVKSGPQHGPSDIAESLFV